MAYPTQLKTLKTKASFWCNSRFGFPSKRGITKSAQGDCVLFNALLTFAEVPEARNYIRVCIGPDGRPVRSPDLIAMPSEEDGFSKDMLLGVLLWTLVTRDPAPISRLIKYINRTGCLCEKASDRRCTMTPQMTYLTNRVAKEVGCTERLKNDWLFSWVFIALEIISALVTPLGYQCHLISVKALIWRLLGSKSQVIPNILVKRDPSNPWFIYLSGDKDQAAKTLLRLNPQAGKGSQWSWERDTAEAAWKDSMGWDVIFLCNLLGKDDA